jgi:hypothetical protein
MIWNEAKVAILAIIPIVVVIGTIILLRERVSHIIRILMLEARDAATLRPTEGAINFFGLFLIGIVAVIGLVMYELHWAVLTAIHPQNEEGSPLYFLAMLLALLTVFAVALILSVKYVSRHH